MYAKEGVNVREIIEYFKSDKGFERLLRAMFDIYVRYGRAFGAVRLTRPTTEEETVLSGFFKRDYYDQALIRIGLADFERQVQKVFSTDLLLGEFLEGYSGRSVISKSDMKAGARSSTDQFTGGLMAELVPIYDETPAGRWFGEMMAHMRRTYRPWVEMYQREPAVVIEMVRTTAEALNNLPGSKGGLVRLAKFSEKYTGSPFALDFSCSHGQLFLRALANYYDKPVPVADEDCVNLYVKAGLLTGGVLSRVTVMGLCAVTNNGKPDAASIIYNELQQAHVLTLENLSRFASVSAYGGTVFIFENPAIFAAVSERLRDVNCTLVCSVGGGTPAFLYLLKMFRKGGAKMYYAGNLDYRGLSLADKLYLEFGKNFIPWHYSRTDYELVLAEGDSLLPDEKKGLAMHNEDLASLLSTMRKVGKTSSSMPLVELFVEDIKTMVKE